MKLVKLLSISIFLLLPFGSSNTLVANNTNIQYKYNPVARGQISKLSISNENEAQPGFTICVRDKSKGEVCLWRKLNTFNYDNFISVSNMAVMTNKQVEIKANILGGLDSITMIN